MIHQKRKEQESILYYFPEKVSIMDQWQRNHFIDELENQNIHVAIFNPLKFKTLENAWESLLLQLKQNKMRYSLFFTGVDETFLNPDVINDIKKIGIPTVLICFDNLHAPYLHKNLVPFFDLVWLTSIETEYLFKKWGANTLFQPYAANPFFFKPSNRPEINTVGFIGTPYGTRIIKISNLANYDIPVSIYSNSILESTDARLKTKRSAIAKAKHAINLISFPIGRKILYSELINIIRDFTDARIDLRTIEIIQKFPSVSFNEMAELYSSFAISLGISDVRNTYLLKNPVIKLHLRTFEIPMSGGLQIINYTNELATYFEDGKEIILYKTEEELISKSKFYLQDSQYTNRNKMKVAARKRAESEHTWTKRFMKVFEHLGM